jgi:phospholipase A1
MRKFKKMKTFFFLMSFFCFFSVNASAAEAQTTEETVLEKQLQDQLMITENPISIGLFEPTFVLPYYYTASPYNTIYKNNTPENQTVMHNEFKAQFSLLVPLAYNLFGWKNSALEMAYTQLNYWQVYAKSQYFRETNYEPEVFVQKLYRNFLFRTGVEHQSNGRGGLYERSWNRVYFTTQYSGADWLVSLKVWELLFPSQSSDLHNPDILHYLGRDQLVLAKKCGKFTFTFEAQNLESGLTRGFINPSISYQLTKHMALYTQFFSGYGQSLIEYNHRTQAAGVGIAFNNWI